MPNPVVHFEVVGKDAATLYGFYGGLFDWKLQDVMDGAYSMVDTGAEGGIPGGVGASADGGAGHVMFYVEVDDPAATLAKVNELGGTTISEPMDIPGGPTIAHFADPEGHVIGIVKGP